MNLYGHDFTRACPNNGQIIGYTLTIKSFGKIMVEDIIAAVVELPAEVFHEDAADQLVNAIIGEHMLVAYHHGVTITTLRGAA